jgi:hypothetical protein
MEFINETPFPAYLARTEFFYKDLLMATVVLKCTFDVDLATGPRPAAEQIPMVEEDTQTDFGCLEGDCVPVKPGCDLAVLGRAHSYPPGREVDKLPVSLKLGEFERKVLVTGDRCWTGTGPDYRPSRPIPFTSMPLTYERAYGGTAGHSEGGAAPFADNPEGRGYVVRQEDVAGTALPNIEETDQVIQSWRQHPLPAGLAPLPRHSVLRGMRGLAVDVNARTTHLEPAAFSFAHPRMLLPGYPAGKHLELVGMHRAGPWSFMLPEVGFFLTVSLGSIIHRLPLVPDTLCLFPDQDRFVVVARRALVYQFVPERLRTIRISAAGCPQPNGMTTSLLGLHRKPSTAVLLAPAAPEEEFPWSFDEFMAKYPLIRIIECLPLCPSS